jgi:OOP family OmpA-OmpF porin
MVGRSRFLFLWLGCLLLGNTLVAQSLNLGGGGESAFTSAQSSNVSGSMSNLESTPIPSTVVRDAVDWYDDRWYLTLFSNALVADGSRNAKGSSVFSALNDERTSRASSGLAVGKAISPDWTLELRANWDYMDARYVSPSRTDSFNNFNVWSVGIDAQWFFLDRLGRGRAYVVQPYVVAGIGAINDKASSTIGYGNGSATSFMSNVGVGVVWPFSGWGRLVFDWRSRYDANRAHLARHDNKFTDWLFAVGLQIPLGSVPEVATPKRPTEPMTPPIALPPPLFRTTQP